MSGKYFVLIWLFLGALFCSSQKSTPERKRDLPQATAPDFSGLAEVTIGPNGEVTLSWPHAQDAQSPSNAIVYEICLATISGGCLINFTANYTTVAGATQYTLTNLPAGVTYYVVVRARNEWGILDSNTVEKNFSVPGFFSYWESQENKDEKILAVASGNDGYLFCLELSVATFNQSNFPLLTNLTPKIPYPGSSGGAKQSMVVKVNFSGQAEWFSFIGQSPSVYHQCWDIAFVSDGFVILSRVTGAISNMDGKSPLNSYVGDDDILLVKFSSSGNLLWYTFWGGSQKETPEKIGISPSGKILVLGSANGSYGTPLPGYSHQGGQDALLVVFSANGSYENHMYLGSAGEQYGKSLALAQDRIVLGIYSDGNFTVNSHNPIIPHSFGTNEGFAVVVFNSNLNYEWHTFFGTSSGNVSLKSLTLNQGDSYFLAETSQNITSFAGKNPIVGRFNGKDMLLGKYNGNGQLQWFTYIGSNDEETAVGLITLGDALLVGGNCAANIPTFLGNSPRYAFGGQSDICLFAYNTSGALLWYSFSSLAGLDSLYYIRRAIHGNLLLVGSYSGHPAASSIDGILAQGVKNKNSATYSAGLFVNFNAQGKIK